MTAIQVVANFISHASYLGMYVSDYFKEDTREREWRNERKGRRPLALAHEGMANPLTLKTVHVPSPRRRRR